MGLKKILKKLSSLKDELEERQSEKDLLKIKRLKIKNELEKQKNINSKFKSSGNDWEKF